MEHKTKGAMIVLVVLAAFLWLVPSIAEAAAPKTVTVACVNVDPTDGDAINKALGKLKPGDTLLLTGTCKANIVVRTNGITVDGATTATVDAADTTEAVIRVRATRVTIKGLHLENGDGGVSVSGVSNATIDNNEIGPNAGGTGVSVSQESAAIIINNNIHDNQDGILVNDNSTARIGFADTEDTAASANNIHANTRDGIRVFRSSNARIFGNTISSNTKKGINVDRLGMVEAAGNTIDSNGENGIQVRQNSGVNLGTKAVGTGTFQDEANTTNTANTGFGISCKVGGYIAGKIGTLNGTTAAKEAVADGCVDKTVA